MNQAWEQFKICTHDDLVCFNDIAKNVILSKSIKNYMGRIPNKQLINNLYYITQKQALLVITKGRSLVCSDFLKKYNKQNIKNDDTIIDLYQDIYKYNGNPIELFRLNNEIWFKGKSIAVILGYNDHRHALSEHVDDTERIKYEDLYKLLLKDETFKPPTNSIQPHTIFINQAGLFSLIMSSKLESAIKFKKWIIYDVLPKIFNYGSYTDNKDLEIENYYDTHNLTDYANRPVVYLAYIGYHNCEHLLKFGISGDISRRELKERSKTFIKFNILHI